MSTGFEKENGFMRPDTGPECIINGTIFQEKETISELEKRNADRVCRAPVTRVGRERGLIYQSCLRVVSQVYMAIADQMQMKVTRPSKLMDSL